MKDLTKAVLKTVAYYAGCSTLGFLCGQGASKFVGERKTVGGKIVATAVSIAATGFAVISVEDMGERIGGELAEAILDYKDAKEIESEIENFEE